MVRIILLRIWVATIRLGVIIPHRIVRILIIGLISRRWGRRCGSLAGSVLLHRKLKSLGVVTSNKAGARVAHVPEDGDEAPPHEAREAG